MIKAIVALACSLAFPSSCGGQSRPSLSSAPPPAAELAETEPESSAVTESVATSTSTSTPITTLESTITDMERTLVAECVTQVWGTSGYNQDEFDTAIATCSDHADALDQALGADAGDELRELVDTTVLWIRDDIDSTNYPGLILSKTGALQAEYYPSSDAVITDDTKRAIAGCTNAMSIPGVLTADIASFGDRTALDTAIEACDLAYDATQIDAALDAPGVSIARLISLDVASIRFTLSGASLAATVGEEITVADFDQPLFHRLDRLNILPPSL